MQLIRNSSHQGSEIFSEVRTILQELWVVYVFKETVFQKEQDIYEPTTILRASTTHVQVQDRTKGRRDVSEVNSTDSSARGPEFNSQQTHGSSQPSVMRSGALLWPAGNMQTEHCTHNKS